MGTPNSSPPVCEGHGLFDSFCESTRLSNREIAAALKVKHPTVLGWRSGAFRPGPSRRLRIARWTRNRVPVGAWLLPGEMGDVQPFRPARHRPAA